MLAACLMMMLQAQMRATRPTFFVPVAFGLLFAGGIGWLVAAVLGFARARAFGASTRWFSLSAVCLIIYHVQLLLLGVIAAIGAPQNDFDLILSFGAFFNLFVFLGAVCAIMGFIRLTNPR